jgi:hypothetical protein
MDYQKTEVMKDKKPEKELSKSQMDRLFQEGYKLAFLTKKRTKPWDKIFQLWFEAAKSGHIRAQFYLATCYDHGYGVDKNIPEAFNWYFKAAQSGSPAAQYNIGFFYKKGEFVKQDLEKAAHWYSLSANQGDPPSQRELGYCYFYGEGVEKNQLTAIKWYKKAARKEDRRAMYNLGLCYEYGEGVAQSDRWARYYYLKACKLGHKKAKKKLICKHSKIKKINLLNFGVLRTDNEERENNKNSITNYFLRSSHVKFFNKTDKFKGELGLRFGIEYFIEGYSKSKNESVNFSCKILHPKLFNPNTKRQQNATMDFKLNYLNESNFDFYLFEFDWEIKKGIWTFQIIEEKVILLEKSFIIQ